MGKRDKETRTVRGVAFSEAEWNAAAQLGVLLGNEERGRPLSAAEAIRRAVAAQIAKYGRKDDGLSVGSAAVLAGGSPPPKGGSGDVRMAPTPAGTRGHRSGTCTLGNVAAEGEGARCGSDGGGGAPPVPRTSAVALATVSRKPFTKEQQTRKRGKD